MPDLINKTPLAAEVVPLIHRNGRNVVVAIAKASYLVAADGKLSPPDEPVPLWFADVSAGPDPATAPLRIPSDLTDGKPAVDVLLIAPPIATKDSPMFGRRLGIEIGPVSMSGAVGPQWPFGPIRRDLAPRKNFAGTYDAKWAENRMPLLPEDFDPRFHQAAPPAQTTATIIGDEKFRFTNLYQDGQSISGELPGRTVVAAIHSQGEYAIQMAKIDTVCVHLEQPIITLVWRLTVPTKRSASEVELVFLYYPRLVDCRELYGAP